MRSFIVVASLLVGCSAPSLDREAPQPLAQDGPPFCSFALAAPVSAAAELDGYFGRAGEDCVPPEAGELFRVGLGLPSTRLIVRTPRPLTGRQPLGGWTSISLDGEENCSGFVQVLHDIPDWEVEVEATCPSGRRLDGWLAGSFPAEWR